MSLPACAKIPVSGAMKPTLIVSAAHAASAPAATHEASVSAASVLTSLELLRRAMSDLPLCAPQAVAGLGAPPAEARLRIDALQAGGGPGPHPPRRDLPIIRAHRARARGGRGDPARAAAR